MRSRFGILSLAVALAAASVGVADAQTSRIRSVRVAAAEVAKTSGFYEAVFGLKVVRTIDRDGALYESILNYGATPKRPPRIPPRSLSSSSRRLARPILRSPTWSRVKDLESILTKAKASGGTVSRPATTSAATGSRIAFVKDPAGNEIELIEEK